jgi:tetratricopeptide (TPR) repeat protein
MLEAYQKHQTLKALEARLPAEAERVKQDLENDSEDMLSNDLAMLILSRCQLLLGEPGAARRTLETLLSRSPDQVQAKVELAKILCNENDLQAGIRLLREVTGTRPDLEENWRLLGEYLKRDGQHQASKVVLDQYDMIRTFNARLKEAEDAFAAGKFEWSDKVCRHLLTLVPGEVRALRLLARIAKRFHHYEVGTSILAQCLETQPGDVALGLEYVRALLVNNRHADALGQCQRLQALAPETIGIYPLQAEALYNLGRYEAALDIYRELSELHEKRASITLAEGKVLKTVGQTDRAIDCYNEALQDDKAAAQAFWELANLRTYNFSGDEIARMKQLLNSADATPIDKVLIQFSLGKVLEDEGQYAESFSYYQAANSGYSRIQPYRLSNRNASLESFFTETWFSGLQADENTSTPPIFVVGLPRSGSTLVEQILTSHSMVDATTELTEIVSIARELNNPNHPERERYPQSIAALSADDKRALARRYLDFAQTFRRGAPFFVDKTPGNFHHIGLIKTLFPAAKIIDIRRHPMASGWSLYRHFFAESFLYSYDLENIGKYYNSYIELMNHWHRVLPGQILTIDYETLVDDLPAAVEAMLAYCGLPFEQACVDFHLNKRPVATPSSEQVRQPIYKQSLEHWKNYEAFLGPLKSTVGLK